MLSTALLRYVLYLYGGGNLVAWLERLSLHTAVICIPRMFVAKGVCVRGIEKAQQIEDSQWITAMTRSREYTPPQRQAASRTLDALRNCTAAVVLEAGSVNIKHKRNSAAV